jgi:signal transduction histidine kinase
MKRKLLFSLVLLAIFNGMQAQEKKVLDSLFRALNETVIDTFQLATNRAIGDEYVYKNNTKAIVYFEEAKNIAHQLHKKLEEADNCYSIGYCYLQKADYDKSLDYYLQSIKIYEALHNNRKLVNAFLAVGGVYCEIKDYNKAKEYISKTNAILGDTKDSSQLMRLYSLKGDIYTYQSKLDSAQFAIVKGLQIAKAVKDTFSMIAIYSNIALGYKKNRDAFTAILYLDSAKKLAVHNYYDVGLIAGIFNNLGAAYSMAKQYKLAVAAFDSSLYYCRQNELKNIECENYKNLSELYQQNNNPTLYAKYLHKYYLLKDSIFNSDTKVQMAELESDYLLNKKDIEIYKSKAQITAQKNQRNILLIIALACIALLTLGVVFYKRLQKRKQLVENQNIKIQHQNEELESLNHLKDRLFSIISHDLRNPLNTLRSYLLLQDNESINADKKLLFKNQTINAVAQTGNLLDNLLTWANMQIKNTAPTIVPLSILEIVQDVVYFVKPQASQKQIEIEIDIENKIIATDADILSIALRNMITNAIKYSYEKSTIQLFSTETETHLFLHIKDNGVGISVQKLNEINSHTYTTTVGTNGEKGSGLGLFLVKELLQKIKVPMQVSSVEGQGSEFVLQLEKMG